MSADLETLLSRAEALDKAATPGPWTVVTDLPMYAIASSERGRVVNTANQNNDGTYGSSRHDAGFGYLPDAKFAAEARTLLPQMARMLRKAMALPERWSADAWFIERSIQKCDAPEMLTDTEAIALDDCADDLRSALTPDADRDGGR